MASTLGFALLLTFFSALAFGSTAYSKPLIASHKEIAEQAANLDACLDRQLSAAARVAFCSEVIENDPLSFSFRAYLGRAEVYREIDNAEDALRDLSSALQERPTSEEALIARGHVYLLISDFGSAMADFQAALAHHPFSAAARRGCIQTKQIGDQLGSDEELLLDCFSDVGIEPAFASLFDPHALELIQNTKDAIHWNRDYDAASSLAHAAQLDPGATFCLLFYGHEHAFMLRDFDRRTRPEAYVETTLPLSLEEIESRLWQDPTDTAALRERGLLYSTVGAWQRAIGDFEAALKTEPSSPNLLVLNATARWIMSKNPTLAQIIYPDAYAEYFDPARMLSDLDQASAAGLDDPLLHLVQGDVYRLAQADGLSEYQLRAAERAIASLPELTSAEPAMAMLAHDAHQMRAFSLMDLGDLDGFREAVGTSGDLASLWADQMSEKCPNRR
ncbi:MAG: tetratricopeptide repeat protein [Pseudomonadota bacterium]